MNSFTLIYKSFSFSLSAQAHPCERRRKPFFCRSLVKTRDTFLGIKRRREDSDLTLIYKSFSFSLSAQAHPCERRRKPFFCRSLVKTRDTFLGIKRRREDSVTNKFPDGNFSRPRLAALASPLSAENSRNAAPFSSLRTPSSWRAPPPQFHFAQFRRRKDSNLRRGLKP